VTYLHAASSHPAKRGGPSQLRGGTIGTTPPPRCHVTSPHAGQIAPHGGPGGRDVVAVVVVLMVVVMVVLMLMVLCCVVLCCVAGR